MSALIAQGPTSLLPQAAGVAAAGMPVRRGAEQGPGLSAGKYNGPALSDLGLAQLGNPRLTEAVLAAAENVRSSAEKLPVSHRLPVSRSVFDSDEGKMPLVPRVFCVGDRLSHGRLASTHCPPYEFTALLNSACLAVEKFSLCHKCVCDIVAAAAHNHVCCSTVHKRLHYCHGAQHMQPAQLVILCLCGCAGSLVSSDEQYDPNANNPQGSALQPLIEEATLALLPDRSALGDVQSFACMCRASPCFDSTGTVLTTSGRTEHQFRRAVARVAAGATPASSPICTIFIGYACFASLFPAVSHCAVFMPAMVHRQGLCC